MHLSISIEEAEDLKVALDAYCAELEFELARTEKQPLQHALHVRSDHLEAIRVRLDRELAAEQGAAPHQSI